jgi:hypothetical protein
MMPTQAETGFEKKRGISRLEIREGYSQVHVRELSEPIMESRLAVLDAVAEAGVSLDFLKLTSDGLSFIVSQEKSSMIESCLAQKGHAFDLAKGRSIVLVHAVNMRDEEGLIAKIVALAISSGARLDHLGDMHDRLLIVAETSQAQALADSIEEGLSI